MVEGSKWLVGLLALCLPLTAASAQPMRKGPPGIGQANIIGSAGMAARLQAQGYSDLHNLRPGLDGRSWMGEATRNGISHTVIASPDGTVIAP
jgi:hypothetical protein